jgi:hypothetical protein
MRNTMINRILRHLIEYIGVPPEYLKVTGHIRFRRIPDDWTEEIYRYWWLPEWNSDGTKIVREARMSTAEKDRYTIYEANNLLTTNGRTNILTYMGSTAANTPAFAQWFAVGTFPLVTVSPGDTALGSELYRIQPSTATITGTQLDLASVLGSSAAVGTLTEAALFGVNATSTSASGTMQTHALLNSFVKANGVTYTADYLLALQ